MFFEGFHVVPFQPRKFYQQQNFTSADTGAQMLSRLLPDILFEKGEMRNRKDLNILGNHVAGVCSSAFSFLFFS